MKRVAIVTWTRWRNYGTILQSYALQKVIERLGYDTYVLPDKNIIPEYYIENHKKPTLYERISSRLNSMLYKPAPSLYDLYDKELTDKCENFRRQNIKYWDERFDNTDLSKIESCFDAFICGSDQIWTSSDDLFSGYYFLDFVKQKPKISYAPSISKRNYSQSKLSKMSDWLEDFSAVSVREQLGKEVLSGIYKKDISICLDPTLLLTGDEWVNFLKLKYEPSNYVFCYFLGKQEWYKQESIAFCERKGLKLVYPPIVEEDFPIGTAECQPDPKEFLYLILNARYILTDSYHAMIFSLLFHKDFFVFSRFMPGDPSSENSRVEELSSQLGLQDRYIKEQGNIFLSHPVIDFQFAEAKLSYFRDFSVCFLLNSLNV